jgi:hypothetical protein
MSDGPISIYPRMNRHASRGEPNGVTKQSMSGDGGSARLKSDAGGVEMDELGVGGQV